LFENCQTVAQTIKPHHTRSYSLRNILCCANCLTVCGALYVLCTFGPLLLRTGMCLKGPNKIKSELSPQHQHLYQHFNTNYPCPNTKDSNNITVIFGHNSNQSFSRLSNYGKIPISHSCTLCCLRFYTHFVWPHPNDHNDVSQILHHI